MYKVLNNGQAFETLTDEGSKQELMDGWATVDQQLYNAMHETCPVCNGQGYAVRREGRHIVREKMGCYHCHGTGAVLKGAA